MKPDRPTADEPAEPALPPTPVERRAGDSLFLDSIAGSGGALAGSGGALAETPRPSFDGFELLEELGRGGFGVVHRAFDPRLRREVAIKVLASSVVRCGGPALRRFEREGQALARLTHPGIVRVHQIGEHQGQPFLVMDLVRGRSLRELVSIGALTHRRTVEVVRDVALALGEAHAHGLVHRDVSPSNIVVAEDGRAVLIDFGLARDLESQVDLTRTGHRLGTPLFFSPEHVSGQPDSVTPASDVFSLGGTLFHALTGAYPFQAPTYPGLLAKIAEARPTTPREVAPDIDPRLEEIVLRCLRADPAGRYPDGRAVAGALSAYLALAQPQARPAGRRHAALAGVTVVVASLVAASSGSLGWWTRDEGAREAGAAQITTATTVAVSAVADEPADAAGWLARARDRRAAGDRPGVVEACTQALALGPPSAEALALRADAHHELRDPRALADAERALQLDPDCALALRTRGRIRLGRRDPEGALADLSRAVELIPEDAVLWASRAVARCLTRDLVGADADMARAFELGPGDAWSWGARASVRLSLLASSRRPTSEELDVVIAYATRSLELDPELVESLSTRATAHERKGDFKAALRDIAGAVALRPDATSYLSRSAYYKVQVRDHQGVIEDTTRVLDQLRRTGQADADATATRVECLLYRALARIERALPTDMGEAIDDCTRASELAPRSGRPLALRALARWRQQDVDQAATDLARAAQLDPKDSEVLRIQALIRASPTR